MAAALSENEAHLRRSQEAGGVHAFAVGPDGVAICDNGFLALYGLPPGTRLDYPTFLSCVCTPMIVRRSSPIMNGSARWGAHTAPSSGCFVPAEPCAGSWLKAKPKLRATDFLAGSLA
jgi:hypothetical protein